MQGLKLWRIFVFRLTSSLKSQAVSAKQDDDCFRPIFVGATRSASSSRRSLWVHCSVGLLSTKVDQAANKTVANVCSTFIIEILVIPFKHIVKKNCKGSWQEDMALFHFVGNSEWL